ncbi:MAG TPA: sigma-E factor regulatory protein RseB domain-containing protein [Acidimicrobiales bacterium]|jgi:negative regulator of sigma E activity|nr:sigma-E factor regulatory protein RseB domain-containing protein [Acidimicrobiales bacterium]
MRVAVTATFTLLLTTAVAAPAVAAPASALDQARQASEDTPFDGVLDVRWQDGGATHLERLTVQGRGGAMVIQGGNQVMALSPFERLLAHGGQSWDELWPSSVTPGPRPDASAKYQVTEVAGGPVVAGRTTKTVRISQGATVREQLYLDAATSLMLERDEYGEDGSVVRAMAFESVSLDASMAAPAKPPSAEHPATPVAVRGQVSALAPLELADGYRRVGVYRSGGILHALYSDGVYDLSVFEQAGRLRHSDLPGPGDPVAVAGGTTGWTYPWPGGQLVVWSTEGRILTAVSDAPADQLLLAVRSLPPLPPERPSLLSKLKRACRTLMEPLA